MVYNMLYKNKQQNRRLQLYYIFFYIEFSEYIKKECKIYAI